MLLLSHFRLAFMVPLVIKPVADFPVGGGWGVSGRRVDHLCHICVCVWGGLFHLRPILSINASPRNLPISSPIKSSPSCLLLPPFRSSESKTSTTTSTGRRPILSVFWCSAVHSVHTRTHSDEPVTASVPPPPCRGTNVHKTVTLGGSACQGKCSCRG